MIKKFSLAELEIMPTLSQGHMDDLKYDDGVYKVWLSRMTKEDGMPYDNQVTVEKYVNFKWVVHKTYQALSSKELVNDKNMSWEEIKDEASSYREDAMSGRGMAHGEVVSFMQEIINKINASDLV